MSMRAVDGIQCGGAEKSGSTPLLIPAFMGNAVIKNTKDSIQHSTAEAGHFGVCDVYS